MFKPSEKLKKKLKADGVYIKGKPRQYVIGLLPESLLDFIKSDLVELNESLCQYFMDNPTGYSISTLKKFFAPNVPYNPKKELVDLVYYYVYGSKYIKEHVFSDSEFEEYNLLDSDIAPAKKIKESPFYVKQSFVKQYCDMVSNPTLQSSLDLKYRKTAMDDISSDYYNERVLCNIVKSGNPFSKDYEIHNLMEWKRVTENVDGKIVTAAADWYFNYDQREFLVKTLTNVFNEYPIEAIIDICEVFSPSYIHHYSYVHLIIESLKKVNRKQKIVLHVIDPFQFPLIQIDRIHRLLENDSKFEVGILEDPFGVGVPSFAIREDFVGFIKSEFDTDFYNRYIGAPKLIPFQIAKEDFTNLDFNCDIITEHIFMFDKSNRSVLKSEFKKTRDNYKVLAPEKLHLIVASNISDKVDFDYSLEHKKLGFINIASQKCWDIFDESIENLHKYSKGDKLIPKTDLNYWVYEMP